MSACLVSRKEVRGETPNATKAGRCSLAVGAVVTCLLDPSSDPEMWETVTPRQSKLRRWTIRGTKAGICTEDRRIRKGERKIEMQDAAAATKGWDDNEGAAMKDPDQDKVLRRPRLRLE